ncbi:MAG: flagellar basal body-associated FliL family protein [Desulfovibrionaceae bacterium]
MADESIVQEEPKKKKGLLKWIIILVLVLGIAGGAFMFKDKIMSMIGMGDSTEQAEEPTSEELQAAPGFKGEMATVPDFVANINDPLGKRYVKLGLVVELINEEAMLEFNDAQVKVKNMLLILLGSKKPQEMLGPKNQLLLQQEIVDRINQIIGEGKVLQVYFSSYLLQ